eukprot:10727349-Alexandrium_andersonii.AAC.1
MCIRDSTPLGPPPPLLFSARVPGGSLLPRNNARASGKAADRGARGSSGAHAVVLAGVAASPKMGLSGCQRGLSGPSPWSRSRSLTGP